MPASRWQARIRRSYRSSAAVWRFWPARSATPQFTGAYLLEPAALLHIPENEVFDCHLDLLPALEAAGEKIIDYVTLGYWNPLNTFAEYIAAQQIYLSNLGYPADAAPAPNRIRRADAPGRQLAEDVWMDPGSSVHASAQITPPVYIGAGCRIGRNVELGPAVVIGANSIVDDDASISRESDRGPYLYRKTYVHR